MTLGTWGPVTFEASATKARTWHAASRSGDSRWHKHDVHNAKPVSEFIGPDNEKFNMTMRIDVERGLNPADELRVLREQRDLGAHNPLIIGGELLFDCFIAHIGEEHRRHDGQGRLLAATVEIAFEEYN